MKRFILRRLVTIMCASGMLGISTQALAAAFQLWEQDGASVGNYHAGYAAQANDASTAWYNPAGIVRIKNQQLVLGADSILSDFKYKGNVTVIETPFTTTFTNVTAQGGTYNLVPDIHYVLPINDWIGFGFSVDVPFGLKTDYGRSTPLRYAATLTSVSVIDISPSLGFKVMDNASLGIGFDVQRADAEFDSVGTLLAVPGTDTAAINRASGTGYGFHLGGLYEFSTCTRVGISYHSQVTHHLTGHSKFYGPIANVLNDGTLEASHSTANFHLPAYTAFSVFHQVHPQVALMGTVIYTQWNTFKKLVLNNVAGAVSPAPFDILPSTSIQVVIPENYRNTWNVSVGADYYVTDHITLRGAVGYDQTPVRKAYRNVQLPDNDRYVIALGGHYQISKSVGADLGWTHLFIREASVNPPPQVEGAQVVTTTGHVKGGADVIGAQITWDIA